MKGKFAKILGVGLGLALVLSLSLVMAAPVPAASPADTDVGFEFGITGAGSVVWESGAEFVDTGNYSVKLDNGTGSDIHPYVEFIPEPGTTMSDLATIGTTGFRCKSAPATVEPNMELRFTAPDFDPTLTGQVPKRGHADVNITNNNPSGDWETEDATLSDIVYTYGNDPVDGTSFSIVDGASTTLALTLGVIDAKGAMTDHTASAADWELTRVRIELSWAQAGDVYIDDITIDGVTYELEPIFLDAEYYSVGDTVEVTVPNFAANTDSVRINPVAANFVSAVLQENWTVTAMSTSDPGAAITVALEETGANTGVFTSSFTTTTTLPVAEDEVYVEDGDTITVTYLTSDDDWGTGVESTTIITAKVDESGPTITIVRPTDGQQIIDTTPEIKATYTDIPAGIDDNSVEMFLDGDEVDATATTSSVTYTPEDDLADGSYNVTVNVSDLAGNEATKSWSFRIVSWLDGSPVSGSGPDLDELDTVGVAVSGATGTSVVIEVGRYASNPEPDAPPTFSLIGNGFFDVKVTATTLTATQIELKFADPEITAESTAYVWGELEGEWLECSDQGYNSTADPEYLWVKVRDDTTPSITELTGTPFAISGEPPPDDILAYYRGLGEDPNVVETTDLLQAGNDWANEVVPSGFTEPISTTQLLALANEWAATD